MRAGSLDRAITIQRATEARDDFGEVSTTWADVATLRAALIQASTTEFLQGAGLQGEAAVASAPASSPA
ncbi:head-tail adaptor protein [Xanthobacter autotrophicus]|uniref:head-tail adaptor protein n=1 Tax=Xanthobacter autotrophicus TaxID=280 RepID=UPI00372AA0CC